MELVSVVASPQTLMKSKIEPKGETKGLDPKEKDQEKFSDVLVKQSGVKPEVPRDRSAVRIKEPIVEKKSEVKNEEAQDEPIKEDSEPISKTQEMGSKRLQLGEKPERSKTERQKAILTFMDSFESEFRIPPQKVVEAMADLSHDQMVKSPDETADAVINKLDLDEDQVSEAKQMYVGLLMQLRQIDQKTQAPSMDNVGKQALLQPQVKQRFELGLEKKMQRDQGLQSLSNRFWMKNPETTTAAQVPAKGLTEVSSDAMKPLDLQRNFSVNQELEGDAELSEINPNTLNPTEPGLDMQALKELNLKAQVAPESLSPQELKQLVTQMRAAMPQNSQELGPESFQDDAESKSDGIKIKSEAPQFMVAREGGLSGLKSRDLMQKEGQFQNQSQNHGQKQSDAKDSGFEKGSANAGQASIANMIGKKVNVEDLDYRKISSALNPDLSTASVNSTKLPPLHNGNLAAPIMGTQDQAPEANVRQIMNQAQYLIKNGGGEMKVQMSPEGLGNVQLKVHVSDGKVNLQMVTETKEAKNAIESSMADLKQSLSAQKLSVDHVKIDVVSSANTENKSQSNMNFNSNEQRQSTQQFWNKFQDNFGSRSQRDGFFDISTKGYSAKRDRDPLQPLDSVSSSRKVDGKGSGLNLVA